MHICKKNSTFAADLENMGQVLIVIGMIAAAMLLLCVGVILRKDHSFRSQHIHQNERMRKDGIHCATSLNKEAEKKAERKLKV